MRLAGKSNHSLKNIDPYIPYFGMSLIVYTAFLIKFQFNSSSFRDIINFLMMSNTFILSSLYKTLRMKLFDVQMTVLYFIFYFIDGINIFEECFAVIVSVFFFFQIIMKSIIILYFYYIYFL